MNWKTWLFVFAVIFVGVPLICGFGFGSYEQLAWFVLLLAWSGVGIWSQKRRHRERTRPRARSAASTRR